MHPSFSGSLVLPSHQQIRRAPLGNQARRSGDSGRTWSEAMILSGDGISSRLSQHRAVGQCSLLTVWYETMKGRPQAVLRQAHWALL